MDDAEYARQLFEILTRPPDPDLAPGRLGQDRIERHDGFGSDLRVTSIDVVPGEHGNQIDIGFVLDMPELVDIPARGSRLLPLDPEWRELSGYEDPADYAPFIALRLMSEVHRHISVHQGRRDPYPNLPDRDAQWALLLEHLGHEGTVVDAAPGRVLVRTRGQEDLTVLMTPEQWEQEMRRHGTGQGLSDFFTDLLGPRRRDEGFLVVWEGELTRSTREKLPPVRGGVAEQRELMRRIAEMRAANPDAKIGW
jgi:hypothetical protein